MQVMMYSKTPCARHTQTKLISQKINARIVEHKRRYTVTTFLQSWKKQEPCSTMLNNDRDDKNKEKSVKRTLNWVTLKLPASKLNEKLFKGAINQKRISRFNWIRCSHIIKLTLMRKQIKRNNENPSYGRRMKEKNILISVYKMKWQKRF